MTESEPRWSSRDYVDAKLKGSGIHPSIPRVLCLACGTRMMLAVLCFAVERDGKRGTLTYLCDCGHRFTQPAP